MGGERRSLHGQRCLVTGASGFIGTALCRELAARGAAVFAFGRTGAGTPSTLGCDVTSLDQVRAAFATARPDLVFHLAARVSGARSIDLVLPMLNSILMGTVHVLLVAAEQRGARVICLGSLQEPDEHLPLLPNSPYAAAKLAASAYARMFVELYGTQAAIVRPLMVYGAGQIDRSKLVPYIISRLLQNLPAELSSGRQCFDWVYIDDVVEALIAAATADGIVGQTIDVGSGVLTSVADVARSIATYVGQPDGLLFGAIPDRKLEPTRTADVAATTRLLGWAARVPLAEGLRLTVEWERQQLQR